MLVLEAIAPSQARKFDIDCEGFELIELAGYADLTFAFWLLERKESLKAKEYTALLRERGIERREANKKTKLAELARTHGFSPEDLARLGTMVFSLTTPSNALVWEVMKNVEELTQVAVDAIKKEVRQTAKALKPVTDPRSILKREKGGVNRYGQLAKICDQELITKLERIFVEDGVPQTQFLQDAVSHYESQRTHQPAPTGNAEPLGEPNDYIKEKAIALQASSSAAAIPTSSAVFPVAVDEQANAHAKLSIDEQLIASTAAPNILASSDTSLVETDEISSSIDTVSESQKETPANEQAITQAELNKHIEEPGDLIAHEVSSPSQATTTQSDRESATTVFKEITPHKELHTYPENEAIQVFAQAELELPESQTPNAPVVRLPKALRSEQPHEPTSELEITQPHPSEDSTHLLADDVISVDATPAPCYPPAKPTERYKLGWQEGDKVCQRDI